MTEDLQDSLSQGLIDRFRESRDKIACRVVDPGGVVEEATYGELLARAKNLVALFHRQGIDRSVIVVLPNGIEFAATFLAGLLSGKPLIPLPYPEGKESAPMSKMLLSVQRNSESTHLITDDNARDDLARIVPPSVDLLIGRDAAGGDSIRLDRLDNSTISHLQYTSGSTAQPKGAILSHRGLLHNIVAAKKAWNYTERSVTLSWIPLSHIFGLTSGLLVPLYCGGTTILVRPPQVATNPMFWLKAVSKYRVTHSGATNFGFQLCNSALEKEAASDLNLACWKVAYCGGETIREATVEKFVKLTGRIGFSRDAFYSAYGLTEYCGLAACKPPGERIRADSPGEVRTGRPFVSCGGVVEGGRARIADPETLEELHDGVEGEILLSGPCLFEGYWKQPGATRQSLVVLQDGTRSFRTGDLGFLRDGQVYVTGRLKELIVVKGEKYHPIDIELCAKEIPDASNVEMVAFSVEGENDQEDLIVLFERGKMPEADCNRLANEIRRKITLEYGFAPRRVTAVSKGFIARTRTKKIQRLWTRDKYVRSTRNQRVAEWLSLPESERRAAVEEYLEDRMAGLLRSRGLIEIDPEAKFSQLGLGPDAMAKVRRDLSAQFPDREFSSTIFFEYPTTERLTEFVLSLLESEECGAEHGRNARVREAEADSES